MVACAVVGCANRTIRDRGIRFFRFPIRNSRKKYIAEKKAELVRLRRNMWIVRLGRQDLFDDQERVDGARVCSQHFVKGKPAELEDINDVDWAPSLYLGHDFFETGGGIIKRKRKKYTRRKLVSENEEEVEENPDEDITKLTKEKNPKIKTVKKRNDSDSNVTIIYLKTNS